MTQPDLDKAVVLVDDLVTHYNQMQENLIEIRELLSNYHEYLLSEITRMKEPDYER